MQTYKIPLVPGPVSVPEKSRAVYPVDYGSDDLEEAFFSLYAECESKLQTLQQGMNVLDRVLRCRASG